MGIGLVTLVLWIISSPKNQDAISVSYLGLTNGANGDNLPAFLVSNHFEISFRWRYSLQSMDNGGQWVETAHREPDPLKPHSSNPILYPVTASATKRRLMVSYWEEQSKLKNSLNKILRSLKMEHRFGERVRTVFSPEVEGAVQR